MQRGKMRREFLVKGLSGFGGIQDEQAAVRGIFYYVINERRVIEGAEICGFDAFEGLEKGGFILDDRCDFL
jgi:hypothetical protein